jgi:hypothetical protein
MMMAMNPVSGAARVLFIADDPVAAEPYAEALKAGGCDVYQAATYIAALPNLPDVDIIVLLELAMFAYPGQSALVLRVPSDMSPDEALREVRRRVGLRATRRATVAV